MAGGVEFSRIVFPVLGILPVSAKTPHSCNEDGSSSRTLPLQPAVPAEEERCCFFFFSWYEDVDLLRRMLRHHDRDLVLLQSFYIIQKLSTPLLILLYQTPVLHLAERAFTFSNNVARCYYG